MKKLKKIWWNIVVQLSIICGMAVVYFFVRYGIPKQYRMTDAALNKWIKDIGHVVQNLSKSKDDIPTIINKSKNIFDHFLSIKNKNINFEKTFQSYIKNSFEDMITVEDPLFISIFRLIQDVGTVETSVMLDSNHMVYHYLFLYRDNEYRICVAKNINDGVGDSALLHGFSVPKGLNYYELVNILFERYNNQISISIKHDEVHVSALERLACPETYKFPEDTFAEIKQDIDSAKKQGQQRSFVLFGLPGTGKTSFCFELSKRISGKVLKLDSSVLRSVEYISATELKYLLEALECDFIIVDDIDRIQFGEITTLLFLLEVIKTLKNKATLLCTANNLGKIDTAVLRPGRIDDIYEFALPNHDDRKDFISRSLKDQNLSDIDLNKLSSIMEGWTHSYMQEFCFQFPICGSVDRLVTKIEKRKKYLERGRTVWNEDEEESLKDLISKDSKNSKPKARALLGD